MRPASAKSDFERMVLIETDECVVWEHACWKNGYGQLWLPESRTLGRVHVMALERRTPRPSPDMWALHGECHNRACINYRHLYWGTPKRNQDDRKRDGTMSVNRGEANGRATLTQAEVDDIRAAIAAGESQKSVAMRLGRSHGHISLIYNRKIWK